MFACRKVFCKFVTSTLTTVLVLSFFAIFANASPKVALLVQTSVSLDDDEANIEQFLVANFFNHDIVDAAMIKNNNVDLSVYDVLYMRSSYEPASFNDPDIIARVKARVENGATLIIEYYGLYMAQYLGAGTISASWWGPAVADASYYVEKITDSPLLSNIQTWSPPLLPDNDAHLIARIVTPGASYRYPLLAFSLPSELVWFKYLYTTYGWSAQITTSEYCIQHEGLCTSERSVYDESNISLFWPYGIDDRLIETLALGEGKIVRLGMVLIQHTPATNLIIGPVANQIRINAIGGGSWVYPVDGIQYSSCPVDSGAPYDINNPASWYTMAWAGKYTGNASNRCEGSGGHPGVDILPRTEASRIIKSIGKGNVIETYYSSSYGNYVIIGHYDEEVGGFYSIYCHLANGSILVNVGDPVEANTQIGTMGSTGNSSGVHLHFQIDKGTHPVYDKKGNLLYYKPYWTSYTASTKGKKSSASYPSPKDSKLTQDQLEEAATNVNTNTWNPVFLIDHLNHKR